MVCLMCLVNLDSNSSKTHNNIEEESRYTIDLKKLLLHKSNDLHRRELLSALQTKPQEYLQKLDGRNQE